MHNKFRIKSFFRKLIRNKYFRIFIIIFVALNIIITLVINVMVIIIASNPNLYSDNQNQQCSSDGLVKAYDNVVMVTGDAGSGSGFFIDKKYVVTNNHVSFENANLKITNDRGLDASAKVVATDIMKDLAILEVKDAKIEPLKWSKDDANPTEDVYAIGYPGGSNISVTKGIISSIVTDPYDNRIYLQTDSAINAGNSGGPLVDKCGKVVGVNTSAMSEMQNMGFSLRKDQAILAVNKMISSIANASDEEKNNSYPSEQAEVIAKYYSVLSAGNYEEAYAFFSAQRQVKYPFENWKKGFDNAGFIRLKSVDNSNKLNTIKVNFLTTDITKNYDFVTKEYSGEWVLLRENNLWKMFESNIKEIPPK